MQCIKTLLHQPHSIERRVRQQLLQEILHQPASFLISHDDYTLTLEEQSRYDEAMIALQAGVPFAYVVGHQAFWTLDFKVNSFTLIPRPDTERLIEAVLTHNKHSLSKSLNVLDLGTGSGCIAVSLAHECPNWQITAIDKSPEALAVAQQNALTHHCTNVTFLQGSWFEPLTACQFDIIVSNPPYIAPDDRHLAALTHEPLSALTAKNEGLADIAHIVEQAKTYLKPQGLLVIEHGYDQGGAVQQLFRQQRFQQIQTLKDYGGHDRVTLGVA